MFHRNLIIICPAVSHGVQVMSFAGMQATLDRDIARVQNEMGDRRVNTAEPFDNSIFKVFIPDKSIGNQHQEVPENWSLQGFRDKILGMVEEVPGRSWPIQGVKEMLDELPLRKIKAYKDTLHNLEAELYAILKENGDRVTQDNIADYFLKNDEKAVAAIMLSENDTWLHNLDIAIEEQDRNQLTPQMQQMVKVYEDQMLNVAGDRTNDENLQILIFGHTVSTDMLDTDAIFDILMEARGRLNEILDSDEYDDFQRTHHSYPFSSQRGDEYWSGSIVSEILGNHIQEFIKDLIFFFPRETDRFGK